MLSLHLGFVTDNLSWNRTGSLMSLLAPDLLTTVEDDMFCLCRYSPRLMGIGGPLQAWVPLTDLFLDGESMDKLPKNIDKTNGFCKNISF